MKKVLKLYGRAQSYNNEYSFLNSQNFNLITSKVKSKVRKFRNKLDNKDLRLSRGRKSPMNSKLHEACVDGKLEKVESLLLKSDINMKDENDRTPIHIACLNGHLDILKAILQYCPNLDFRDKFGMTPLIICIAYNHPDLAYYLLESGANALVTDDTGSTALHYALKNSFEDATKILVGYSDNLNIKDKEGIAPLHVAVANKDKIATQLLLENGADPNVRDSELKTPLMLSSIFGQDELVNLLNNYNADPNLRSDAGKNAYEYAIQFNNISCAEILQTVTRRTSSPTTKPTIINQPKIQEKFNNDTSTNSNDDLEKALPCFNRSQDFKFTAPVKRITKIGKNIKDIWDDSSDDLGEPFIDDDLKYSLEKYKRKNSRLSIPPPIIPSKEKILAHANDDIDEEYIWSDIEENNKESLPHIYENFTVYKGWKDNEDNFKSVHDINIVSPLKDKNVISDEEEDKLSQDFFDKIFSESKLSNEKRDTPRLKNQKSDILSSTTTEGTNRRLSKNPFISGDLFDTNCTSVDSILEDKISKNGDSKKVNSKNVVDKNLYRSKISETSIDSVLDLIEQKNEIPPLEFDKVISPKDIFPNLHIFNGDKELLVENPDRLIEKTLIPGIVKVSNESNIKSASTNVEDPITVKAENSYSKNNVYANAFSENDLDMIKPSLVLSPQKKLNSENNMSHKTTFKNSRISGPNEFPPYVYYENRFGNSCNKIRNNYYFDEVLNGKNVFTPFASDPDMLIERNLGSSMLFANDQTINLNTDGKLAMLNEKRYDRYQGDNLFDTSGENIRSTIITNRQITDNVQSFNDDLQKIMFQNDNFTRKLEKLINNLSLNPSSTDKESPDLIFIKTKLEDIISRQQTSYNLLDNLQHPEHSNYKRLLDLTENLRGIEDAVCNLKDSFGDQLKKKTDLILKRIKNVGDIKNEDHLREVLDEFMKTQKELKSDHDVMLDQIAKLKDDLEETKEKTKANILTNTKNELRNHTFNEVSKHDTNYKMIEELYSQNTSLRIKYMEQIKENLSNNNENHLVQNKISDLFDKVNFLKSILTQLIEDIRAHEKYVLPRKINNAVLGKTLFHIHQIKSKLLNVLKEMEKTPQILDIVEAGAKFKNASYSDRPSDMEFDKGTSYELNLIYHIIRRITLMIKYIKHDNDKEDIAVDLTSILEASRNEVIKLKKEKSELLNANTKWINSLRETQEELDRLKHDQSFSTIENTVKLEINQKLGEINTFLQKQFIENKKIDEANAKNMTKLKKCCAAKIKYLKEFNKHLLAEREVLYTKIRNAKNDF
ncbi:unnamed protein product [Gordionus sp. m RMFG-2023]